MIEITDETFCVIALEWFVIQSKDTALHFAQSNAYFTCVYNHQYSLWNDGDSIVQRQQLRYV